MIKHIEPTVQIVRAFSRYMLDYYNLEVVLKSDSRFMRLLAWVLDVMGVMDKNEFMKSSSMIIGNKLYLPFVLGEENADWPPSRQIAVLTHECQHIEQRKEEGNPWFFRYIFSSAKRARYEADAYRVNMELFFWYTGELLNIDAIEEVIRDNYGCSSKDAEMAKFILERSARHILEGLIVSKATKVAMIWLKVEGSEYQNHGDYNIIPSRYLTEK